ncbi:MAG TPA: DUF4936 family protein [Burkholderiaceae bacterium]|nr:DUF4936 family protein [Burkholderiaceae bacterium]
MTRAAFVYYRVSAADADAALRTVREAQARWRERLPTLVARVWRRDPPTDAEPTLMETYEGAGEAWAAIDAELRAALAPLQRGERHLEWFVACA